MPITVTQVKDALVAAIRSIKTVNSYTTNLEDSHVFDHYVREALIGQPDSAYPMCFVVLDRGQKEKLPQESSWRTADFVVIFVCKKVEGSSDPTVQTEAFITDIENLLRSNDTLGGTVHVAEMDEWEIDSGTVYPEGCAMVYVTTRRLQQG